MRNLVLTCVVAAAVAAPAQAGSGGASGRELKITGTVVRASAGAVSVESATGDMVLTCAVPERLATTAAAFKVGDEVRMFCVRYRGRRAQLLKLQRPKAGATEPETREKPAKPEKPRDERQAEERASRRPAPSGGDARKKSG